MPTEISEEEIYKEAKRRVKKKRGFYVDLGAYVIVNTILIIVWSLSDRGYPWFLWPLGTWGIFLLWAFIDEFVLYRSEEAI